MPSIKMLTVSEPGSDLHGPLGGESDYTAVAPLDLRSPDPLAPHIQGYYQARRNADAIHTRRVNEAARLWADVVNGRLDPVFLREARNPRNPVLVEYLRQTYPGMYRDTGGRLLGLRETMAQTDYQALYADVIDRLYYGYWKAWPIVNLPLVKQVDLRDFRQVKRFMLDNMSSPYLGSDPGAPPPMSALLGPTPQNAANPPTAATSTAAVTYQPWLFQAGDSINWAAFVNDDLGIFKDCPQRLAMKANRGNAKFITGLYADVNGPNTSGAYVGVPGAPNASVALFNSGFNNRISTANGASSTNPRLTSQALVDGYNILAGQTDSGGDPIMLGGPTYLVYGRFDYGTAKNLANSLELLISNQGGVAGTSANLIGQLLKVKNWAMENLTLIYDPYLSIVAANNPFSWFMALSPDQQLRPGIEYGTLTGFKEPQLFTEIPTTARMGGGPDATMGNFWTSNQNMKIMGVQGGTAIDGRSWCGSNGSGS
jgi:hypothetical protein